MSLATQVPMLAEWVKAQEVKGAKLKNQPIFNRNLEEMLDVRRAEQKLITLRKIGPNADFSSNDFLSLGSSGMLRAAFLEELARLPNFNVGSTGSRLLSGNNDYIEALENEIAEFHSSERALIVNSGFEGNCSIFSTIPRAGDAIVYDELVHASVHEGMARSSVIVREPFKHNDVESFREVLENVLDSQPAIRDGHRCVIIAVETIYSMDGDVTPLKELVEVAKELFPAGNAQFVVDEAHSTGVVGPKGAGLVCSLGLQKEVAIRLHTFSKALSGSGGVILCNDTVRTTLINNARPLYFTASPSYPTLAAIKAGYRLLKEGATEEAQQTLQSRIKLFFTSLLSHPAHDRVTEAGIFHVPLMDNWESKPFLTQIVPIITPEKHNYFLTFHLQLLRMSAYPVDFPVVPKGESRVRLVFKATNTEQEIVELANAICEWADEMLTLKKEGRAGQLPRAARQVYSWLAAGAGTNGVH